MKKTEKKLSSKGSFFPFFWYLIPLTLGENSDKSLGVTQIRKRNNVKGCEGEWEWKEVFQRQAATKYLRLTLFAM